MKLWNTKYFEKLIEIRERIFNFLTLKVYFPFCKSVYKGQGITISMKEMMEMPANSLGRLTASFLQDYHLEPMPGYEAHDMKHTLLGFPANMEGEIRMQYFEFGNGNRSIPVMTVMFFGTLFMPEKFRFYANEFLRGSKARDLSNIDLKLFAHQSIHQLKKQWYIH